jgi:hypothetical protein
MSLTGHVESGGALLKRAEDIEFVKCEDGDGDGGAVFLSVLFRTIANVRVAMRAAFEVQVPATRR